MVDGINGKGRRNGEEEMGTEERGGDEGQRGKGKGREVHF